MKLKEILKLTWLPVVGASLCCLSPVIIVLLGLGTVSFGTSLADSFYGDYKWAFRAFGAVLLLLSIIFYYRGKGVCSLDQAKKHRNEIINTVLISLLVGVLGYVFFSYAVFYFIEVWMGLWV